MSYVGRTAMEVQGGPFQAFSQHGDTSCRVRLDGQIRCDGSLLYSHMKAHPPADLRSVQMIRTGQDHACALDGNGRVLCWGDFRPPPAVRFISISQPDLWGSYCGIRLDGETYCWGDPARKPTFDSPSSSNASQNQRSAR